MEKIGLITLWRKNYGSALQCYALKNEIESQGFKCEVIEEDRKSTTSKYIHYVKEALSVGIYSICYRGFLKKYKELRAASKKAGQSISDHSDQKLELFGESELQPKAYTYGYLHKLANSDKYKYFIAGSDQIWGGHRKMEPIYFLKFVPPNKRIAYSPSFGTDDIEYYNKRSFRREIRKFNILSVREENGQKIIKDLTGKDVVRIADPVFLKTAGEWSEFAEKAAVCCEEKYILLHFLDAPNSTAVQSVKHLINEKHLKIIEFAYPHKEFSEMDNYTFLDGDPRCYIKLIEKANYIITDSFHSSVFSIIFQKEFFVFERNYQHSGSQRSRLVALLNRFHYEDRLIADLQMFDSALKHQPHSCEELLNKERYAGKQFLQNALGVSNHLYNEESRFANADKCTGCMACVSACNSNAIIINTTDKGYEVPTINLEKCTNCGRCKKICDFNLKRQACDKSAFVAYNSNAELRKQSASGGIFSALAKSVLDKGGVVFGAKMYFEEGKPKVIHVPIYNVENLPEILQSKYVQSDASMAYKEAKKLLNTGRMVLFCGTSCQIDGLYRYLGDDKNANLYTVDLICHGVPGRKFFEDYISYLENQSSSFVGNFSFRSKVSKSVLFCETIDLVSDKGKKTLVISLEHSPYYRLFMNEESYREACYDCQYASVNKPADITLGDYFELVKDYPELYQKISSNNIEAVNSVIVRTPQGKKMLDLAHNSVIKFPVDLDRMQASHKNLCKPSQASGMRDKIFVIYNKNGFCGIDKFFKGRDFMLWLPRKVRNGIKRYVNS